MCVSKINNLFISGLISGTGVVLREDHPLICPGCLGFSLLVVVFLFNLAVSSDQGWFGRKIFVEASQMI